MRKIILRCELSPGDIVVLTALLRDLHLSYPEQFQTDVRTTCGELWEHNPYLTELSEDDPEVEFINCESPLVEESNTKPYHFINGFRLDLSEKLGLDIPAHSAHGDIYLSDQEKGWLSQVDEITGTPNTRFWIIAAGGKTDMTSKWWAKERYQEVVDYFQARLLFVQCGSSDEGHLHPKLHGVIDLIGKTDMRQATRLMYHADGVVCPVTMFMHLAAAVETKPGRPRNRPCVVVAGGREPSRWEAYPHHQYLQTNGCLPCCDDGGCWRCRVTPLGDGDQNDKSLCLLPTKQASGEFLPRCLDMIEARHVIEAIERYLQFDLPH